jgi:hypothetical protein
MRDHRLLLTLVLAAALLGAGGCAKQYVVTTPLAATLAAPAQFAVGDISDQLPADLEAGKRPSAEDIQKFKRYIAEEIHERRVDLVQAEGDSARYEVTGSLLDYSRGSGALRFFVGFGAGKAKVLTQLRLVDRSSGATVFAGNFEGMVTDWSQSGDQMFRLVAKNFAKEATRGMKVWKKPRGSDF